MIKKKFVIFVFWIFAVQVSFAQSAESNCNLLNGFEHWRKVISSLPGSSVLRSSVSYSDYLNTAKSLLEEDGYRSGDLYEAYIKVSATNLLYKSAWFDARVYKVEKYKEVCKKPHNHGELVISYTDIYGESKYTVIPFSFVDGSWKRSFSMTSGYSYILDMDAEEIISKL